MSAELVITNLFIFALAGFLGLEVIRRIPKLLHTPLMALTNALSAIALVASIVILGQSETTYAQVLGFIAVVASTINVVGGFLITDRMLKMFRPRERPRPAPPPPDDGAPS
jgi:H+-translocating NAD(P) transhydrogenase subunit alpha